MEHTYNTTSDADRTTVTSSQNLNCRSRNASLELLYNCMVPSTQEWFFIVAYIIIFVVGVIGNTLVCFAVWRNKELHKMTNVFMVNLSVADLAVLVVLLPSTLLMDITGTWFLGRVMCKVTIALGTVCISVSVMTLCSISIERWYAICRPLHIHSTVRRARIIIGVIWVISIGVALPEFIASTVIQRRPNTVIHSVCYPALWNADDVARLQICMMAGLYFIPLLIMGCVYLHIAIVLWKGSTPVSLQLRNSHQRRPPIAKSMSRDNLDERKRAAKLLVVVVVVFAICFLPNHALNILRYTGKLKEIPNVHIIALVAHWTILFNSCINPVLYNFMSETFRKEFRVAIYLCLRCGRRGHASRRKHYSIPFAGRTSFALRSRNATTNICID